MFREQSLVVSKQAVRQPEKLRGLGDKTEGPSCTSDAAPGRRGSEPKRARARAPWLVAPCDLAFRISVYWDKICMRLHSDHFHHFQCSVQ